MSKIRTRGEQVRTFILENVEQYPDTIAQVTATEFDISRQAVNKHLKKLVEQGALSVEGKTRSRRYQLKPLTEWIGTFEIEPNLAEDFVWGQEIVPRLGSLPDNVMAIWNYGFTEMFNNAIDHSEGSSITVQISRSAADTDIYILDDGIGIFKKIQTELGLLDERHSVLELAKGKLTTAPERHSGKGIFLPLVCSIIL